MKKFRADTLGRLKRSKQEPDIKLPCPVKPAVSLKRSNAKLHKSVRQSSVVDLPSFEAEIQQAFDFPKPHRPSRVDSGVSQPVESKEKPAMIRVPYGMYGFREVPAKSSRSKATGPEAPSDVPPRSAKRQSIFGALKKKQSIRPADNFTMWDDKPGQNKARESTDTSFHTAKEDPDVVFAGPSNSATKNDYDPYEDASSAQQSWAKPQEWKRFSAQQVEAMPKEWKSYTGKGKQRAIDSPQLGTDQNSTSSPNPVDSGVGMTEDETANIGLQPRAARSASPSSYSAIGIPTVDQMNRVIATETALREQIERYQQEWQDELRALQIEKEELLERQRQEEEDRLRAIEIQAEEERIAAELARERECVCCGDSKNPLEFSARSATETCEHDSRTCRECMESWLASEFDSKGTESIKCPECPSTLTYADIQRLASEKTFEAYEKILTRNALASLPEFSWCLAPKCTSGQLNAENANFMDCVECGYKQCLTHKVPWHVGETCDVYEYRTSGQKAKDEEAATEAMLDTVSKLCPGPGKGKSCGWRIQKIDGCDHMTCRRCRHEFCWECLASHRKIKEEGNTAHLEWCKFHSKNLDVAWPFNAHA